MERRHNGGRIVEGIEWRGRMKEQNGEKTEQRKNSGRSRMRGRMMKPKLILMYGLGKMLEEAEWRRKNRRGITEKEEWRKKNGRRKIVDE